MRAGLAPAVSTESVIAVSEPLGNASPFRR